MRCKSCDVGLKEVDLSRKDPVDGSFLDLCGACYGASEHHRYMVNVSQEELAEEAPQSPQERSLRALFEDFVEKHDLESSWADGLSLKWSPEERVQHFRTKCYNEFFRLKTQGIPTQVAVERACGIHKANRRHEHSGASYAYSVDSVGGMGGPSVEEYWGRETVGVDV